jgi:spore coat polysaccharide biosynthesis protein SpsF
MTRTVVVVQARTGSTRLPGKVLLPLLGEPVLSHVMRRVARALTVDEVVVATTRLPADDPIAALAAQEEWPVVRGSEMDLLERYLQAATSHAADLVVRVTSDCPLIDPGLIDDVVGALMREGGDYASNTLEPRTYPRGLDVEVVTTDALQRAGREDRDPASREHATPWVRTHPERFGLVRVAGSVDHSAHRWTLDTPEDYELLRRIYEAIGHDRFGWGDALAVVEANPAWSALNRHVPQKPAPGA